MAATLLKIYGSLILKYPNHVSKCNTIGKRKINFHTTAKNFEVKCDDRPFFRTRLALPPDYENVVDFMCEAYYKYEPLIINIGLAGTEAPPIWRTMMFDQVRGGYSIIAEDRDNCIIGAALNCVVDSSDAEKMYCLAKCCSEGPMRDLIEFFGFVSEAPKLWERFCVMTIFEQASLAVKKDFQSLGIGKRLIQESWHLARDCGFRLFRMDCNNSFCSRICQGYRWEMIWHIPFSQYTKNGKVVFKCVKEPHTVCRVFIDRLQYCKTYCPPYKECKSPIPPPEKF